jgi:hypothetical protein
MLYIYTNIYIFVYIYIYKYIFVPIPVIAQSKGWICCRLITVFVGSNPARAGLSLVTVVGRQVSTTGRSLVQRSPVECVCVCVCVSLSVIRCNINPLHL